MEIKGGLKGWMGPDKSGPLIWDEEIPDMSGLSEEKLFSAYVTKFECSSQPYIMWGSSIKTHKLHMNVWF